MDDIFIKGINDDNDNDNISGGAFKRTRRDSEPETYTKRAKYLDLEKFEREKAVCRHILSAQNTSTDHGNAFDNVVKVIDVLDDAIVLERLDTSRSPTETYLSDVDNGLVNLHNIGVLHLDIKFGNVGWSISRQQWCLFDFDTSALFDVSATKCTWILPPLRDTLNYEAAKTQIRKQCANQAKVQNDPWLQELCQDESCVKYDTVLGALFAGRAEDKYGDIFIE